MPVVKRVEQTVGLLLGLIEEDDVVLVAIGVVGAEQADAAVGIAEDEPAEVAGKELRAAAHGHKVVIRTGVRELGLDEPLL
ncbi:MAG: hypothetical protein IAG10_27185 [Planctomycetaceae bacterium]|nr:hypothetical protein [Planctomycetaceae bacterium]